MSKYIATVRWRRDKDEAFVDNQYSRGHEWRFDGGFNVPASASPHVVPLPYSVEDNVDPEEAFVASLSSCYMLFFLSIAAKNNFVVNEYVDHASGLMEINEKGKLAMTKVVLKPRISFFGKIKPDRNKLEKMHHQSHEQCFIANSVTTEVTTVIQG